MRVVIAGAKGAESLRLVAMICSAGDASVVAVAKRSADAIRIVLDEEPDVLVVGSRFDGGQGLALLHAVRPLLPALRIVVVSDRPGNEFQRAFLLGDIDLLLAGPDRAEVISEMLQQWQGEKRREPWAPLMGRRGTGPPIA
jgi:chemotaxis response regulator CheB